MRLSMLADSISPSPPKGVAMISFTPFLPTPPGPVVGSFPGDEGDFSSIFASCRQTDGHPNLCYCSTKWYSAVRAQWLSKPSNFCSGWCLSDLVPVCLSIAWSHIVHGSNFRFSFNVHLMTLNLHLTSAWGRQGSANNGRGARDGKIMTYLVYVWCCPWSHIWMSPCSHRPFYSESAPAEKKHHLYMTSDPGHRRCVYLPVRTRQS